MPATQRHTTALQTAEETVAFSWLDAELQRGADEDALMRAITARVQRDSGSVWDILAHVDQHYRRGNIPGQVFHALSLRIGKLGLGVPEAASAANTALPVKAPETPPAAEPAELTVDFATIASNDMKLVDRGPRPGAPRKRQQAVTPRAPQPGPALAAPEMATARPSVPLHKHDEWVLRQRYVVQELLGQGGIGQVYKALDRFRVDLPINEQYVAIKLIHSSLPATAERVAELRREFHCAQSLSHPNVVRVYEFDRDGELAFFTMELLPGMSLAQLLSQLPSRRLPLPCALAMAREISAAVAFAHSRGVVHGDLKPDNVMITTDGSLRVLDFGVSRRWQREPWISDPGAGGRNGALTPHYASCELLEGQHADPRDDLYALGCMLYETLTGEHPFRRQIATEARRRGLKAARPDGLSARQWRALTRCLAWSRVERPASVEAWLADLGLDKAAPSLPALSVLSEMQLPSRSGRRTPALATVLALVAIVAAVVLLVPESMRLTAWQQAQDFSSQQWNRRSSPRMAAQVSVPSAAVAANKEVAVPASADIDTTTVAAAELSTNTTPAESSAAPPVAGTVQFVAGEYSVPANSAAARIVVRRTGELTREADFVWWTRPDSARPGEDYIAFEPKRESFAPGEDAVTVYVPLIIDGSLKGNVSFEVLIGNARGATLGERAHARVYIYR